MNGSVKLLDTGPTDAEYAEDLKTRVRDALAPVVTLVNEASRRGLIVSFQIGSDQFGRQSIQHVNVVKPL